MTFHSIVMPDGEFDSRHTLIGENSCVPLPQPSTSSTPQAAGAGRRQGLPAYPL
eukprot:CAMPEP_0174896856 /NCGR_PEP_ID=MMETSP0167-20121228/10957_1 /TAXON_ID=38298 /ORGANISM="Rhodella maculata, Strain CCMP736" /LENGTH=53 /DNA_ID=CAMNT_0016136527 /DNA_START=465 /DNA_END=626 /DNA_ORIENTATION=-